MNYGLSKLLLIKNADNLEYDSCSDFVTGIQFVFGK